MYCIFNVHLYLPFAFFHELCIVWNEYPFSKMKTFVDIIIQTYLFSDSDTEIVQANTDRRYFVKINIYIASTNIFCSRSQCITCFQDVYI